MKSGYKEVHTVLTTHRPFRTIWLTLDKEYQANLTDITPIYHTDKGRYVFAVPEEKLVEYNG